MTSTSIATARTARSKEEYVRRAAQLGVWKKHDHLVIPSDRIASVRRLGEDLPSR